MKMSMFDGIPENPFNPSVAKERIPTKSDIYCANFRFSPEQVAYMHRSSSVDLKKDIKDRLVTQLDEKLDYFKRLITTNKHVNGAVFETNYRFVEEDPYHLRIEGRAYLKALNGLVLNPSLDYVDLAILEGGAV